MARPRPTEKAVAETASIQEARAAAGARVPDVADELAREGVREGGPGSADPLVGDLRRAGLLPLLVLHSLSTGASYGHQLMERIRRLTGGLVLVNPNTMYPLLRSLEGRGLIRGKWEHPERRSRRFYELTRAGARERDRLKRALGPHLDRVADSISQIRHELLGTRPRSGAGSPARSGSED